MADGDKTPLEVYMLTRFKSLDCAPDSWQERLFILEAYNYCQKLSVVAAFFRKTLPEIKKIMGENPERRGAQWRKDRRELKSDHFEDLKETAIGKLLEAVIEPDIKDKWPGSSRVKHAQSAVILSDADFTIKPPPQKERSDDENLADGITQNPIKALNLLKGQEEQPESEEDNLGDLQ